MSAQNGTAAVQHLLDEQFEAFKSGVRKLIDRIEPKVSEPSRLRSFATRAGETIKAHPLAAAGIALGVGYAIVRIVGR